MKTFTTALLSSLLFLAGSLCAQAPWSPLPFGSTAIYRNSKTGDITSMRADSILQTSSSTRFLILRKYIRNMGEDCDSNMLFGYSIYTSGSNNLLYYDYTNDSLITFNISQHYSPVRFNFNLDTNELFEINSHFLFRLDSITTEEIYGITDSIRYFSFLSAADSLETGLKLKLSKRFGLLSFPLLSTLLSNFNISSNYTYADQIGFSDSLNEFGYRIPEANTFLNFTIGDEYLYETHRDPSYYPPYVGQCDGYMRYTVDSISTEAPWHYGHFDYYDKHFYTVKFANACYPGFDVSTGICQAFFEVTDHLPGLKCYNGHSLWFPRLTFKDEESKFKIGQYYDKCTPSTADGASYYSEYSSRWGITKTSWNAGFGGAGSATLYASKTAKGNFGIWPKTLGIGEHQRLELSIYPNPSSGLFYIETDLAMFEATVTNTLGAQIFKTTATTIDLSVYPSGIYFVNISSEKGNWNGKLVKEGKDGF